MSTFLPFWIFPGSWGLKGKVREEAEAYYRFEGEELDRRLNEIHGRTSVADNLQIDLKYQKLTEYEYDTKIAELVAAGTARDIALLEVEFRHGKISENEYEKAIATAEERPWIKVVNDGFTTDTPDGRPSFTLELDWNTYWVEYLRIHGYTGIDEEDVVERWFQDTVQHHDNADEIGGTFQ